MDRLEALQRPQNQTITRHQRRRPLPVFRPGSKVAFAEDKLQHEETGGVRGGQAVQKSRLVIDAKSAKRVKAYLEARATGLPRSDATKLAKLQDKPVASLIGIERNALTYAGYTVWKPRGKAVEQPARSSGRVRR